MRLLFCFTLFALVFFSCNLINPDEELPAFISIPAFNFNAGVGQGTDSQNITELWVYANGDIRGIYDTPALIPLLDRNNTRIEIYAGIKNDGNGATRIKYPFYSVYDTTVYLSPLDSISLNPSFSYQTGIDVDFSRDFENGFNMVASSQSNQGEFSLITNPEIAYEGNRCGKLSLDAGDSYLQFKDLNEVTLPSGNTIFLELDYSCNTTFIVGVFTTNDGSIKQNPIVYINPTTDDGTDEPVWNKIYIDLGAVALEYPNASAHNFYFECYNSTSGATAIYLDNLKLIKWI